MKILEVSPYGPNQVSGILSMVRDLALELTTRGHPTSIALPGKTGLEIDTGQLPSMDIPSGAFANFRLSIQIAVLLWRMRQKWDLVHVHQAHPISLVAAILARILGKPTVVTIHVTPPRARALRGFVQLGLEWLRPLVCNSTVYVSEHTRQSSTGSGVVIYNGIPVARVRKTLGNRESLRKELRLDGFVIAFLGRHEKMKGYEDLLQAVRRLIDNGINVHLLAIGSIPRAEIDELEAMIRNLGLGPFITDLGQRTDRLRYISAADVVALPSYLEGFPLSLLEAMAAEIPVVATTVGGIPELVQSGQQGYLVSPGDVERLTDILIKLSRHPDERRRLGRNGLERAQTFDLKIVASEYIRVFEQLAIQ